MAKIKIRKYVEQEENSIRKWGCEQNYGAKHIVPKLKESLEQGELVQIDFLPEKVPGDLEKNVEELKEKGLNIGNEDQKFGYFIYPSAQPIETTRRLFIYRRN